MFLISGFMKRHLFKNEIKCSQNVTSVVGYSSITDHSLSCNCQ